VRALFAGFLLFGLILAGCGPTGASKPTATNTPDASAPAAAGPVDPWVLEAVDVNDSEPALLWNGLIGVRIARDGSGLGPDSKPLGFFCVDEYDTSGEEKIRTLPNPLAATFKSGLDTIDPQNGTGYRQTLDMGTGMLTTEWVQEVSGAKLKVHVQTAIHPEQRILADRWTFTAETPVDIQGTIPLDAAQAKALPGSTTTELKLRWNFGPSSMKVLSAFSASGGVNGKGKGSYVVSDAKTLQFHGVGDAGRPASFQRIHSFGKSPNWIAMMASRGIAYKMASGWDDPEPLPKFQGLAGDCAKIWSERWKTDIEIDGPLEDQRAVRSFLFYLRSAVHPETTMSVSPMGLSNQQYNGHVFWDADIWVFPALAFISPETAIQIAKYRVSTQQTASSNFAAWVKEGRPTASGKVPAQPVAPGREGALMYPWESSVSGRETVPGPSKFEHHITGSIAFMADRAFELGLLGKEETKEIVDGAGSFYAQRSEATNDTSPERSIKGVMSPDEHHTGDNDLYTNLLAEWCIQRGKFDATRWGAHTGVHPRLKLPRDSKTFLTYENDALRGYKQAAAVLSIYPLKYPPAEKEAKAMMDRFADKVTENGPAMSDSIHALIWARLGEKEKAYSTWHESWQPFTDHPLMLFSEKRKKAVTYFTTGAAGSLQTVLYGFLGFRIDSEQVPGAAWSKKLHGESWLSIKPNLPPSWKSVKFKNFKLLGESYTLTATPTTTNVVPGE
jgi:trehalose/maltose hydrolase-like predicted phosphorylase